MNFCIFSSVYLHSEIASNIFDFHSTEEINRDLLRCDTMLP